MKNLLLWIGLIGFFVLAALIGSTGVLSHVFSGNGQPSNDNPPIDACWQGGSCGP